MSFVQCIYGLRLRANLTIPGLAAVRSSHTACDLFVHLKPPSPLTADEHLFNWSSKDGEPLYPRASQDSETEPSLRVLRLAGGEYVAFFYRDGARFAMRSDGSELWADWPEGYLLEDAATYLVGPVMGYVLRLKGVTPLHASAVEVDGRAVAIVGPPGAGKSTTAAAFAQLGHGVLSDDVAALHEYRGQFDVAPGYPRVNLWPDSVQALHGSEDALPSITPTWGKRYLALDRPGRFESSPLPLGAIYLLGTRNTNGRETVIEDVPAPDALLNLVANTYVNYVLDREMRRREFDVLTRLISTATVRRVHPCGDASRVAGLCAAIAADARNMMPSLTGITSGAE